MLSCSWGVNDTPAIFPAASSISRVIRGASCATANNAPGINARLPAEKHSRKRRRFRASARSFKCVSKETSACLRLGGRTWVDFHVHLVGREQGRVTGNRTNPVVTGCAESYFRLCYERFSVNRRADFRIELYFAGTPIQDPPDPQPFHSSSNLAISGTVSAPRFGKAVVSNGDS